MARYTDNKGNLVEVSEQHVQTAIDLKIELQKISPRISWAQHKRMMKKEGYEDSGSNESYRCMIKNQQKKLGLLPSVEKYANFVSDNKLKSIREEIGEIKDAKLQAQQDFLKLNRTKREMSKELVLIESVERALSEKEFSTPPKFTPIINTNKKKKHMILAISDVHYGAYVNVEGRHYNTKIAKELFGLYIKKSIEVAKENNVEDIYVMGLGDYFEHDSLRHQNAFSAEKSLSEQVVDFSEIIIEALQELSQYANIYYSAIAGNHDRINGNKNDSLYGEHMVSISNKIVETFIKYSGNERLMYIPAQPYHHIISVSGKQFLFVHGDRNPMKKSTLLAEMSALYRVQFDAIIAGHIHHFTMVEVGEDRYAITFGSIKGSDEYSLKTLGVTSSRSQGLILVDEDGEFEIKKIKL